MGLVWVGGPVGCAFMGPKVSSCAPDYSITVYRGILGITLYFEILKCYFEIISCSANFIAPPQPPSVAVENTIRISCIIY